ncbi:MAG: endo-1,4-beta-xylanase [Rhodothermia bacterium]|nr:endo-1,4-beta-xylanase [Rhodothermia bacterium]
MNNKSNEVPSLMVDTSDGEPLLPPELRGLKARGRDRAHMEIVGDSGYHSVAIRAESQKPWHAQVLIHNIAGSGTGEVLRLEMRLRTTPGSEREATVGFIVEAPSEGTPKSLRFERPIGFDWATVSLPFRVKETAPGGRLRVALNVGYGFQSIDIQSVQLYRYGEDAPIDRLPSHNNPWTALEDSDWKASADERIRAIRQDDLIIQVVDAVGRPVQDAQVSVQMKRHAFRFGTAVNANAYLGRSIPTADAEQYVETVHSLFNAAVLEGTMKWTNWEVPERRAKADTTVSGLLAHGLAIRGHALVWPSWNRSPSRLRALEGDPQAVQSEILAHIAQQVTAYRGEVAEWDVVNEPYTNDDLVRLVGLRGVAEWFEEARRSDPSAGLVVNDFDILETGDQRSTRHVNHVTDLVRKLRALGAPVTGVGLQAHFDLVSLSHPETMLSIMDSLAAAEVDLVVTEYDIDLQDDSLASQYTRDFMTAVFSHPAATGFFLWGFWDGRHWKDNALLYEHDWTLKPAGRAWMDLVFDQWWTQETGTTDATGRLAVRGFLGEYSIQVTSQSRVISVDTTLRSGGTFTQIRIN